jgi:hypothetical protein
MTRESRVGGLLDAVIVLLFALCLWAPWDRSTQAATSALTMVWLSLPMALARGGAHLESVTVTITICALATAALGAIVAILGRMRGSAATWAAGFFLFAAAVAILMQRWTAVGFLGAMLLLLALRVRFVPMAPMRLLAAVLRELWPAGYAMSFGVLAWRYEPRLLVQALVVSLGLSLVARALLPAGDSLAGIARASAR